MCTGMQGTGSNYDAHHKYLNSQWQTDAINFAVSQLKSAGVVASIEGSLPTPVQSLIPTTDAGALVPTAEIRSTTTLAGVLHTVESVTQTALSAGGTAAAGVTKAVASATKSVTALASLSKEVASVTKSVASATKTA